MKNLKDILSEASNYHSMNDILQESLRIKIDDIPYSASPTTWDELRQIIEQRYDELGPGTKQEPINFNDIDVSGMTTFYDKIEYKGIFTKIRFEYIDLSNWNVSNVKDMCCMFKECYWLNSTGDISNWDVSKVECMNCMFQGCTHLKSVSDISNWDVSNVTDMYAMFYMCENLESVGNLSNWDVLNTCDKTSMFTFSGIKNIPDWYKI